MCKKIGEKQFLGKKNVFETTKGVRYHFLAFHEKNNEKDSSPASYLYKYLMKNIAFSEKDMTEEQARMGAWKGAAQLRQMSWINLGHGFVGRWRAVFSTLKKQVNIDCPVFLKIREFMSAGDWSSALKLVAKIENPDLPFEAVYEEYITKYGELSKKNVGYVTDDGEFFSAKSDLDWQLKFVDAGTD